MKQLPVTIVMCCAAATFALNTASARDDQSSSQQSTSQDSALQKAQAQEFFRASKIIGKDTQSSDNQKIGSIKDVVFNQQGQIFALVDIGSSKLAVVPWQSINAASAKGTSNAQLNVTQQELKSGPCVTKDQWGALDNPTFTQGVYSYYHVQSPTAMGAGSTPGGASQGQGSSQDQQQKEQNQK